MTDPGQQVSELGKEAKNRLDRVNELLATQDGLKYTQPEYQDVISKETFECIDKILSIVSYYGTGQDIDITLANSHLMMLAALEVNISMEVGRLQGMASDYESFRKIHAADRFIGSKRAAESISVKITDAEADNIARSISNKHYKAATEMETASRVLWCFYQAVSHFIDTLNHCANREVRLLKHDY